MPQPLHDRIPEIALDWHGRGGSALAIVVDTWGSAPRPAGSQLVVSQAGEFEGSVSGGCVEGAVVTEAVAAIGSGQPVMLDFGVADEDAFAVGLACGGRIRVLVDPVGSGQGLPAALLAELVKLRLNRRQGRPADPHRQLGAPAGRWGRRRDRRRHWPANAPGPLGDGG